MDLIFLEDCAPEQKTQKYANTSNRILILIQYILYTPLVRICNLVAPLVLTLFLLKYEKSKSRIQETQNIFVLLDNFSIRGVVIKTYDFNQRSCY